MNLTFIKSRKAWAIFTIAFFLAMAFAVLMPTAAFAVDGVDADPGKAGGVAFTLPTLLQLFTIVNVVIWPLLVGYITNSKWSSLAKYLLHAGLTAAAALTAELADALVSGTAYNVTDGLLSAVISFGLAVLAWRTIGQAPNKNGETIAEIVQSSGRVG